jgi:hypothetical protein
MEANRVETEAARHAKPNIKYCSVRKMFHSILHNVVHPDRRDRAVVVERERWGIVRSNKSLLLLRGPNVSYCTYNAVSLSRFYFVIAHNGWVPLLFFRAGWNDRHCVKPNGKPRNQGLCSTYDTVLCRSKNRRSPWNRLTYNMYSTLRKLSCSFSVTQETNHTGRSS